jgi:hypothetical protein
MLSLRQVTRLTTVWLLLLALITTMALRATEPLKATLRVTTPPDVEEPLKIGMRGTMP